MENKSSFEISTLKLIGVRFLCVIIIIFTFGLSTPWVIVRLTAYETKHIIIDGKRLKFVGTGLGFLGQLIIALLLYFPMFLPISFIIKNKPKSILINTVVCIVFIIYSTVVYVKMKRWITKNTHFEEVQ